MVGLTLGKFMPLHNGHLALIDFALRQVDMLYVLVVSKVGDDIAGDVRVDWLRTVYTSQPKIVVQLFHHDLPHDGVFTKARMAQWCEAIKAAVPEIDSVFTSEPYGEVLASYLGARHHCFDSGRENWPISGTEIRQDPLEHLEKLPVCVRQFYLEEQNHHG